MNEPLVSLHETLPPDVNLTEAFDLITKLDNDSDSYAVQVQELVTANGRDFLSEANLTGYLSVTLFDRQFERKWNEFDFERVRETGTSVCKGGEQPQPAFVSGSGHDQILQLLRLPDVIGSCTDADRFEDAFQLICFVRNLAATHPTIACLQKLRTKSARLQDDLYRKVFMKLRTNPDLSLIFQMISFLRQNSILGSCETDIEFLRIRNAFLLDQLNGLRTGPQHDVLVRLSKTIEIYRSSLYETITQFDVLVKLEPNNYESRVLFRNWLAVEVHAFLRRVRESLDGYRVGSLGSLKSIYDQCRNFTDSLQRIGYDFRTLIDQMFGDFLRKTRFATRLSEAEQEFCDGKRIEVDEWRLGERQPQFVGAMAGQLLRYCWRIGSILEEFEQFFVCGLFADLASDLHESLDRLGERCASGDRIECYDWFRYWFGRIFDRNSFETSVDRDWFWGELAVLFNVDEF